MILDNPLVIEDYTAKGWWSKERLSDLFLANAIQTPQAIALVDPPNRPDLVGGKSLALSYAELQTRVDRLANALLGLGIGKDDVVMVQLPNIAELIIIYLAVARIGAIISPAAVQYRSHELRYIIGIAEPKIFISCQTFDNFSHLEMVQNLQAEFPSIQHIIAIGDALPDGVENLTKILETPIANDALEAYLEKTNWTANDIFTICWTSGTEADPKGVPRSHNHWIAIAHFTTDACEMQRGIHLLNPFPTVNMSAIGGMLVPWLLTGGKLVMHHPLNLPVFLQQIVVEKINYTVAPPVLLNLLLLKPALLENVDLSSIQLIGSGSAPLSPWMVTEWAKTHGINVLNFFGSNEGVALVSAPVDVPDPADRATYFPRFGSAGFTWSFPLASAITTRLVDVDSQAPITEPDHIGEMTIKGPTVFPGYYKRPDLTEKAFDADGFYHTGDLFCIGGDNSDNRYQFMGRLKDIIIRGGMKISSEEIENLITGHPAVAEVAVIGCPDKRIDDEMVVAVVVLKPEQSLTKTEMVDFLKEKDIAHYKLPKHLEILPALPRNPLGKILKRDLRKQLCGVEPESDKL